MSEVHQPRLQMWDRLQTTPTTACKPFKGRGGFSGTAINATYILKRLTEEFGPCGIGWRFVVEDEQIVEGHTLKSGDKAKLHKVLGHLDYRAEPYRYDAQGNGIWNSTSPQFGQTMLVDENKYGPYTDEEAPKKSITDCISKCAVLLGIGADIHLGLYDDNKYVNARKAEEAHEFNAQHKPNGHAQGPSSQAQAIHTPHTMQQEEDVTEGIRNWCAEQKKFLDNCMTVGEVQEWEELRAEAMDRLKRKALPAWSDMRKYVEKTIGNINLKGAVPE